MVLDIFSAFLELLPEDEAKIFQDGGKTEETKVFVEKEASKRVRQNRSPLLKWQNH